MPRKATPKKAPAKAMPGLKEMPMMAGGGRIAPNMPFAPGWDPLDSTTWKLPKRPVKRGGRRVGPGEGPGRRVGPREYPREDVGGQLTGLPMPWGKPVRAMAKGGVIKAKSKTKPKGK